MLATLSKLSMRTLPHIGCSALVLALAACAPGDVALEGKLFQTVGSAIGMGGGPEKEAKLEPRAGLVLPPGLNNALPTPGETSGDEGQLAGIRDYDSSKKVDKTKLAAAQKEFCKVNYELPKSRGDQTVDTVEGPAGPCRPSALDALAKWNKGEE